MSNTAEKGTNSSAIDWFNRVVKALQNKLSSDKQTICDHNGNEILLKNAVIVCARNLQPYLKLPNIVNKYSQTKNYA